MSAPIPRTQPASRFALDYALLGAVLFLLGLGLLMVASASISVADRLTGDPFYFFYRQCIYVAIGLATGWVVLRIPLNVWWQAGPYLMVFGVILLVLVLIIGREVNGAVRWIAAGPFNVQPSELVKLFVLVYMAGYLVRRKDEIQDVKGFLRPMAVLGVVGVLLLLEPDFGSAVVITATALGLLFLGGVRLWQFGLLFSGLVGLLVALAYSSPYRLARLTSFADPWADPFNSGFQLTQALIAFGRGELFGVGLGGSVQKLFYLPEAHTDFLFAVLAEELGLVWALAVIVLFVFIVYRALRIGYRAMSMDAPFAAFVAYGLGISLGAQAFINMGVNMGLLPTKGLTLPLMSFGGSSVVVSCLMCALLLRISHEYPASSSVSAARTGRRGAPLGASA